MSCEKQQQQPGNASPFLHHLDSMDFDLPVLRSDSAASARFQPPPSRPATATAESPAQAQELPHETEAEAIRDGDHGDDRSALTAPAAASTALSSPLELTDLFNLEHPFQPFSLHGFPGKHSGTQGLETSPGHAGNAVMEAEGQTPGSRSNRRENPLLSTHTTTQYFLHQEAVGRQLAPTVLEGLFDRIACLEGQALDRERRFQEVLARVAILERRQEQQAHIHLQLQEQQQQRQQATPSTESAVETPTEAGKHPVASAASATTKPATLYRAVRVGNLHTTTPFSIVHKIIRGGALEQLFYTVGQGYAVAWFLDSRAATRLLAWTEENEVMVDAKLLVFERHATPLSATPPCRAILEAVSRGATNTLYLDDPRLMLNEVNAACSEVGPVIDVTRLRSGTIRIVFGSLHDATEAMSVLPRQRAFRQARLYYVKDECGDLPTTSRFLLQHSRPRGQSRAGSSAGKSQQMDSNTNAQVSSRAVEVKPDLSRNDSSTPSLKHARPASQPKETPPAKRQLPWQLGATTPPIRPHLSSGSRPPMGPSTSAPWPTAAPVTTRAGAAESYSDGVQRPTSQDSVEQGQADQPAMPRAPCTHCGLWHWRSGLHRTPCRVPGEVASRR